MGRIRLTTYITLATCVVAGIATKLIVDSTIKYDIVAFNTNGIGDTNNFNVGQTLSLSLKHGKNVVDSKLVRFELDTTNATKYQLEVSENNILYKSVSSKDRAIGVKAYVNNELCASEIITMNQFVDDETFQYGNFIPTESLIVNDEGTLLGYDQSLDVSEYDSLLIPNYVKTIGEEAFMVSNSALKPTPSTLPDNIQLLTCENDAVVEKIKDKAFFNAPFDTIKISSSKDVTLGNWSFGGLDSISSVEFNTNIDLDPAAECGAFSNASRNIKGGNKFDLYLKDNVKKVGEDLFLASEVANLYLSSKFELKLEKQSFGQCYSLAYIEVDLQFVPIVVNFFDATQDVYIKNVSNTALVNDNEILSAFIYGGVTKATLM